MTGGKLREVLRSHRQGQAESLTGALVKLGRAGPFFAVKLLWKSMSLGGKSGYFDLLTYPEVIEPIVRCTMYITHICTPFF